MNKAFFDKLKTQSERIISATAEARKTPPKFDAIPLELTSRRQWVVWAFEDRGSEKLQKVPVNPYTLVHASSTDPGTWGSFNDAVDKYRENETLAGISFALSPDDELLGIDIDHCVNEITGIDANAQEIVAAVKSYTEYSPTDGVHIFTKAKLPTERGQRVGPLEFYDRGRFLTVTGNMVEGCKAIIRDAQAEVDALLAKHFKPKPEAAPITPTEPINATDREILDRARQSKVGADFTALWEGQWRGRFPSQSEADAALLGMLRFWTGGDKARSFALFAQSGLNRAKWSREDYRESTWRAIDTGKVWEPRNKPLKGSKPQPTPTVPDEIRPQSDETRPDMPHEANPDTEPFRNFKWDVDISPTGKQKDIRVPLTINEIRENLFRRMRDFPRKVGNDLFDHDRRKNKIRYFPVTNDIFAWINEVTGLPIEWCRIEGAVTREELYSSIMANCRQYNSVSGIPSYPPREDVYPIHEAVPAPSEGAKYFNALVDMFFPAEDVDRTLIKALFAAPVYYKYGIARPMFVIDALRGQGSGKTTLVNMVALLYGGDDFSLSAPLTVNYADMNNPQEYDRLQRRMMSKEGRQKRIFLIDNATGTLRSPALASLVTQPMISGMAPYGRGEESRPNDLTFAITSNSASLEHDLITRSIFLHLAPLPATASIRAVQEYILTNRLAIIADIIGLLKAGPQFNPVCTSRFAAWCHDVLAPVCDDLDEYSEVFKSIAARSQSANVDTEDAEQLEDRFKEELRATTGHDPEKTCFYIQNDVIRLWSQSAIPGFGGRDGRGALQAIKNYAKTGAIKSLTVEAPSKMPHRGAKRYRGLGWNWHLFIDPDYVKALIIVYANGDKIECASVGAED